MARIYLDHHSTTPCDPRVVEAMAPYWTEKFGNPASRDHAYGKEAMEDVERARAEVAAIIGAREAEIVFTSGATESDNLAIKGAVEARRDRGNHVITVATEHPAVLDACRALERGGRIALTVLPVDGRGFVDLDALRRAITEKTVLVSVMVANNEIGVLQPVAGIGKICRERDVLFHADAAQAVGKVPVDVETMGMDLASFTAHKLYGPKGIGALYVRRRPRVKLAPIIDGGGHEGGLRSGTLPVPLVVGFGRSSEIARREMAGESVRILALRERLRGHIFGALEGVHLNGSLERRLPGNLNVSIDFVESESLIEALADVAVSSGAACTTAKAEPSHVLKALGIGEPRARSSVRFGIGRFNTEAEIDRVGNLLRTEVRRFRARSPLYESSKDGVSSPNTVKPI